MNPQKIDRQRGSKSNANPTPSTPAPDTNPHPSSEHSSSAAGLNTTRTIVSHGREEETTPTAHTGVANMDEGATVSSLVLVLPNPTPSIPVARLHSKIQHPKLIPSALNIVQIHEIYSTITKRDRVHTFGNTP